MLKKYNKIFKLIASAFSEENITILQSKDNIGSFYEKTIILPKKITISKKKYINKNCYIYKILFSITSKKLNLYIKNDKENIDYKLLASLISVKTVNKDIINNYKKIKNLIKKIYPITNKNRENIKNLKERCLLIEIVIKKLTYEKISETFNLNIKEKAWIFKIENTINIEEKNITLCTNNLYNELITLYKKYQEPNFYLLWGYLYKNTHSKINKITKTSIKNKIKKQKNISKTFIFNKINKIEKKNNIQPIFDYKKTHSNYNNNNKNIDKSTSISENSNKKSSTNIDHSISLLIKANIIKNIIQTQAHDDIINTKITYKEWDHTKNTYKNNWCHLFIKKMVYENNTIIKINDSIKKEIILLKKYIKIILNKTRTLKKNTYGYDIDIESIIDNYSAVSNNLYNKIYLKKDKIAKETALIILIDSSLSTESFNNTTQTLEKLKTIAYIIAEGLNKTKNKFIIATFHSNTRFDCRYLIIKDLNEDWLKKKNTLMSIKSQGYTRIGPALRHSIEILKKIKTEKKLILLLSDGTPTDYDEYEGIYGLKDIKKIIIEAKKHKVHIKTMLTNNKNNEYFIKIIKKNNCYKINNELKINETIIKIFNSL